MFLLIWWNSIAATWTKMFPSWSSESEKSTHTHTQWFSLTQQLVSVSLFPTRSSVLSAGKFACCATERRLRLILRLVFQITWQLKAFTHWTANICANILHVKNIFGDLFFFFPVANKHIWPLKPLHLARWTLVAWKWWKSTVLPKRHSLMLFKINLLLKVFLCLLRRVSKCANKSSNCPTDILKYVEKRSWYCFNLWSKTFKFPCCCSVSSFSGLETLGSTLMPISLYLFFHQSFSFFVFLQFEEEFFTKNTKSLQQFFFFRNTLSV